MNDHVAKPIDPVLLFAALSRYYRSAADSGPTGVVPTPNDEELPLVEGLDVNDALARIGGNRSLYLKLLRQFLALETAPNEITQALERGDWETAERQAHTVNGVAANLGAGTVRTAAAALEQALRDQVSPDALASLLAEFRSTLLGFIDRLRVVLPPQHAEVSSPAEAVDPQRLAEVLIEMHALLGRFDDAATQLFDAQRDLFRAMLSPNGFSAFETQIANYAFADARATLGLVAAQLEIPLP